MVIKEEAPVRGPQKFATVNTLNRISANASEIWWQQTSNVVVLKPAPLTTGTISYDESAQVFDFPIGRRRASTIKPTAQIIEFPRTAHLVVTELRPTGSLFAGKEILHDYSIKHAPDIKRWRHQRRGFNFIGEFFQYMIQTQYDNAIIIRDLTEATDEVIYRRKNCNEKPENVFRDYSAALLVLDIDDISAVGWRQNPRQTVDDIVQRMGAPFSECSYVAQLTGTHGLVRDKDKRWTGEIGGDVMSVRIFFMTVRGLSHDEMKAWLEHLRYSAPDPIPAIDPRMGRPIQVIYLARPKWHGHQRSDDPLGDIEPSWLVERQLDRLPVPDDLPQQVRRAAQTGQGGDVAQHPDADTAVASIGLSASGGEGRGDIYTHLLAAAVHLVEGNPFNGKAIGEYALALRDKLASMCDEQHDLIVKNLQQHERPDDWVEIQKYLRDDIARWIVWWVEHVSGKHKKRRRRGDGAIPDHEVRTLRGARGDDNLIDEFTENGHEAFQDLFDLAKAERQEQRAERKRDKEI